MPSSVNRAPKRAPQAIIHIQYYEKTIMMNRIFPMTIVACLLCAFSLNAQDRYEHGDYYYGFKAGVNYASINEIKSTIIRPFFPEDTYTTAEKSRFGYSGGLFFYYRFENESALAIQPEVTYGTQGGGFEYTDVDDLEYSINFKYQYLHVGTFLKVYPFNEYKGGFHLAIGPQLSFNIENDKLTYKSNKPDLGPDLQIQQNLRDVLKGETIFAVGLGAGYEFPFGMNIEARYYYGLSDVIETQANGYNFIENTNRSQAFQLTLGWAIPF